MGKKALSTKVDIDFDKRFEEAAREKGLKKSEALRRAAKSWMDESQESENDPWRHVPESMNADIKKIFETIRDYQHVRKEHPLDFSLRVRKHKYRDSVGVPDLEDFLSVKWSSKIDSHKKKLKKAFALELLEVEFDGSCADDMIIEGEMRLTELGEKLMRTLEGGNYDPKDIRKINEVEIETTVEKRERTVKRQKKLGVKN
ncbi:MAG: hypothetical protein ACLFU5_00790 [Thermoplasmata archaeon]